MGVNTQRAPRLPGLFLPQEVRFCETSRGVSLQKPSSGTSRQVLKHAGCFCLTWEPAVEHLVLPAFNRAGVLSIGMKRNGVFFFSSTNELENHSLRFHNPNYRQPSWPRCDAQRRPWKPRTPISHSGSQWRTAPPSSSIPGTLSYETL